MICGTVKELRDVQRGGLGLIYKGKGDRGQHYYSSPTVVVTLYSRNDPTDIQWRVKKSILSFEPV
jgi:hypothetical protein